MSLGYFSIPENIFHFYHFLHRGGGGDIYSYTSICIFFLKQGTKSSWNIDFLRKNMPNNGLVNRQ